MPYVMHHQTGWAKDRVQCSSCAWAGGDQWKGGVTRSTSAKDPLFPAKKTDTYGNLSLPLLLKMALSRVSKMSSQRLLKTGTLKNAWKLTTVNKRASCRRTTLLLIILFAAGMRTFLHVTACVAYTASTWPWYSQWWVSLKDFPR